MTFMVKLVFSGAVMAINDSPKSHLTNWNSVPSNSQ